MHVSLLFSSFLWKPPWGHMLHVCHSSFALCYIFLIILFSFYIFLITLTFSSWRSRSKQSFCTIFFQQHRWGDSTRALKHAHDDRLDVKALSGSDSLVFFCCFWFFYWDTVREGVRWKTLPESIWSAQDLTLQTCTVKDPASSQAGGRGYPSQGLFSNPHTPQARTLSQTDTHTALHVRHSLRALISTNCWTLISLACQVFSYTAKLHLNELSVLFQCCFFTCTGEKMSISLRYHLYWKWREENLGLFCKCIVNKLCSFRADFSKLFKKQIEGDIFEPVKLSPC